MPHLVVLYTNNLETQTDMNALCRKLANAMPTVMDENSKQVLPTGGIRVLAYPAAHFAVADGQRDYGFVYLNLRMGRGRSEASKKKAGETLRAVVQEHFAELLANRYIGVTFQIDEGQEVFDAKLSSIHPLFARN
jgi:5-carboxymethyl-2-hydroxymuconate isomerase